MRHALQSILLLVPSLNAQAQLQPGKKAPAWSLPDASDVRHASSQFANNFLLIIGGDKKSQDSNNDWGNRVRKAFPAGLPSVAMADASAVPRLLRGVYRNQFREEASHMGVPYLLDWDGSVTHNLGFKAGVSNVILIGGHNSVVFVITGPAKDEDVKKLCGIAAEKLRDAH
jgi:hypothetical protein